MTQTTSSPQTSTAGPSQIGEGLVEYIRTNRQNAGLAFLAFSVLCFAVAGYFAYKSYREVPSVAVPAEQDNAEKPTASPKAASETEAQLAKQAQYNLAWVGLLAASMVAGGGGSLLMFRPPAATLEQQRSEVRVTLLAVGGLLGAVLILVGSLFFYQWSESLTNWLNKGQIKEAKWVLIPLLMVVAGGGLVFLAIQPARSEERNSPSIRRLVYGSNFALTVMLLLVAIVVANVVFSLKVPNRLDTTETGFFSISDATRNLLNRLNEPMHAYAVVPEANNRQANDIRQLLLACEEASGGKFTVKFLSEVNDRVELAQLMRKYTRFETVLNQRFATSEDEQPGAVLLTVGADETRHAVIPAREFTNIESGKPVFQGESRLFKEIAFLADSEIRPVIYFTQGHGELDIEPSPQAQLERAASRLRAYLENRYLTVRPLDLTGATPVVPDDATVVVVADPTISLSDSAVAALRKYMSNTAKKGKLIALVGANTGPDRKMRPSGLEPFLADFDVRIGNQFLFTWPTRQMPYPEEVDAKFSMEALVNPGFEAMVKAHPAIRLFRTREVEGLSTHPNFRASDLLLSIGSTWPEDQDPADLGAVLEEMTATAKAQQAHGLSSGARSLGVTVTEGPSSRVVAIGSSYFVSDAAARSRQFQAQTTQVAYALMGTAIDWLREKPSIEAAGISSKKYSEYVFPDAKTVDSTRLKALPLFLALLIVGGGGAAVWLVRRK